MYDMVSWFRNPNWRTSHLEGDGHNYLTNTTTKVIQYCHDTGKNLVFMKTANGWPWDVKSYDNQFIYDWITEANWSSASDYKINTPPVAMIPRYWDGNNAWHLQHGSCPLDFVTNCKVSGHGANTTGFSLTGPFTYSFGGNVGSLSTIRINYQWSPVDKEELFLTTQHGWVLWQYYKLINGAWAIQQHSNHNWVVAGVVPVKFPCFTIP